MSTEPEDERLWFRNFYKCYRCDFEWEDVYDAQPDDDCPECGARHVSPYKSEDTDEALDD